MKQHVKIYGLWDSKNSNDSSAAKKPKVDGLDISESNSDSEPEAYFADNDALMEETNDDFEDDGNGNYQEDLASGPMAAKVRWNTLHLHIHYQTLLSLHADLHKIYFPKKDFIINVTPLRWPLETISIVWKG